jgi:CheY-like chemotaxis protein
LDVLLQGEHSWDLLRDLKEDSATHDIPVYVVTVVDNRDKALSLGADGFSSKPVDRVWLLNQLESLLAPQRRPRVLIIDDDSTARYLIRSLLASTECELFEATGGAEGLRMALEYKPALVVLDLAMDGFDGFEVLEALRGDDATSGIPVVVHTSKSLDPDEYARLSSAVDIIPKSIMGTRDLAVSRFSQALEKAGLTYVARTSNQTTAVE